jgi:hypothetical protein
MIAKFSVSIQWLAVKVSAGTQKDAAVVKKTTLRRYFAAYTARNY